MEIVFVRHGHAEHLLDYPNQLNSVHPGLTQHGMEQVRLLSEVLFILSDDLVLVSPTKRTIQTANIITKQNNFLITPLVGPRMFPRDPDSPILVCDQIYSKEELTNQFSKEVIFDLGLDCWQEGINKIDQEIFVMYTWRLLNGLKEKYNRIVIISHDGTITNFRILLGELGLSRKDFLGEAGVYKINI